jgi:hypothetical protein
MLGDAKGEIGGFADVERVVRAAQNVDEPHEDDDGIVGRWLARRGKNEPESNGLP